MSATSSAAVALALAAVASYALTPPAIRLAHAASLLDHPVGYKSHREPTPYLGGAAVLASLVAVTIVLADVGPRLAAVLGCAAALAVVGAYDDRFTASPAGRVVAELVAAWALFVNGVRWAPVRNTELDFILSALWIVGIVNAMNLMDNMDGAAATVAAVSGAGIGTLALDSGNAPIAIAAFAMTGACVGFLPRNLAAPARIFLGDGGSMPLGLLVGGLAICSARGDGDGVLVGAMLAGLPILDTTLISVSRIRRRVTIVTAGRDHLTHRLLTRARSPRRVCLGLLAAQGVLVGSAVAADRLGQAAVIGAAVTAAAAGVGALAVLESAGWRPPSIPAAAPLGPATRAGSPR
ncbi:MAG: MraY family glycosyltransferase [Solirubrobacteraceae bacterium]|jgi:UDP-GlcNAc:undecaprenyl-phosphate GlcNAc-1-phosphate transferase